MPISNHERGTLVVDTVTTVQVAQSTSRSRTVVISNDHSTGRISVSFGLSGAAATPTKDLDFHTIGPYESMPFEIGGAATDFKLISGTACDYRVNVIAYLT